MKLPSRFTTPLGCAVLLAIITVLIPSVQAATVWDGPILSFSELSTADGTQPADQDRITPGVWLTRGTVRGLYNASTESGYTKFLSPAGTEWAFGSLADYASLTYNNWQAWASRPPDTVGQPAVLHLINEDIYMSVEFTSWGEASGGFSYLRSTASIAPEPSSGVLMTAGVLVVGGIHYYRRLGRRSADRQA